MSRVFVLGSANLDQFLTVPHIVQPGETILANGSSTSPGGKGLNQAVAAARSGANTCFLGSIGTDAAADTLLAALRNESRLSLDRLEQHHTSPTGIATIQLDRSGENAIIVNPGANSDNRADTLAGRLADISSDDVLVCQLEIPLATVAAGLKIARNAGATTILNAAPATTVTELLEHVDLLVVNETEAVALHGADIAAQSAATALQDTFGCDVIATLGEAGAQVATNSEEHHIPARNVHVVDTTGAGDAFVGALAAALAAGKNLVTASEWGTVLAAFACESAGAQGYTQRKPEIEAALG